eukprot:3728385-Amphidinium_carterae.2
MFCCAYIARNCIGMRNHGHFALMCPACYAHISAFSCRSIERHFGDIMWKSAACCVRMHDSLVYAPYQCRRSRVEEWYNGGCECLLESWVPTKNLLGRSKVIAGHLAEDHLH